MTLFRHRFGGNLAAGDVWSCNLHTQSDLSIDEVHDQYVTAVEAMINDGLVPLWPTNVHVTDLVTDMLDAGESLAIAQRRTGVALAGTDAGASLAQGTSMVVSWVTARPGRTGRGRIFVPAPSIEHTSATGLFLAAACITVVSAAEGFIAGLAPITQLVLHNRKSEVDTAVTGARVNEKPSFQRRRLNKVDNVYHS